MPTEAWYRNPNAYIRELVEAGECNVAWDRGVLVKSGLDPVKHADIYFGDAYDWRVLAVGGQGTAEYRRGDTPGKPSAVYPTWAYGDDLGILEDFLEKPVGQSLAACNEPDLADDERPVFGQEHRVVIIELPGTNMMVGKSFMRTLRALQQDYPDAIMHVHGLYSWRQAFGGGFRAADIDPRFSASKGRVVLSTGKEVEWEYTKRNPKWVTTLGFVPADLEVPRNRCIFNIKSAKWAAANFDALMNPPAIANRSLAPDTTTPDADYTPPSTKSTLPAGAIAKATDKVQCNLCSLQDKCSYYRNGAVCSLPDAEPAPLARMFKTRDSDVIIEGLGTLMAAGTRRLEQGMQWEQADGELNPEVTKMLNQIFQQGTTLAKLVDPKLRASGTKVNVNVGDGGQAAISVGSPNALMRGVVRELEKQGIPRDQITPQMVAGVLQTMGEGHSQQQVIEGTAATVSDEAV